MSPLPSPLALLFFTLAADPFPPMSLVNMDGQPVSLPADLAGSPNLVVMSFAREHTADIETWESAWRTLRRAYPELALYEILVFGDLPGPLEGLLRRVMNGRFDDPLLRGRTALVFDDTAPLLASLGLATTENVQVFVLDPAGQVLHQAQGAFDDQQATALGKLLRAADPTPP